MQNSGVNEMCSTGHQGAHGHEFLEFEYSYGEFTVGDSDRICRLYQRY